TSSAPSASDKTARKYSSKTAKPRTAAPAAAAWWQTLRQRPALFVLLGISLVGLLGFGLFQLWPSKVAGPPPSTVPFLTLAGSKDYPSFSPDGNQIAFAWDGAKQQVNGERDIYIKLIGVGEPVRLTTSPEDEVNPAWSPDGRYIAFLRGQEIYVTPA